MLRITHAKLHNEIRIQSAIFALITRWLHFTSPFILRNLGEIIRETVAAAKKKWDEGGKTDSVGMGKEIVGAGGNLDGGTEGGDNLEGVEVVSGVENLEEGVVRGDTNLEGGSQSVCGQVEGQTKPGGKKGKPKKNNQEIMINKIFVFKIV